MGVEEGISARGLAGMCGLMCFYRQYASVCAHICVFTCDGPPVCQGACIIVSIPTAVDLCARRADC